MASWYFSDLLRVVRYFGICTVPIFLAALAKWGQGVESVALVIHRGEACSLWRWCPALRSPIWRWRSLIWRWRPSPWSKPSLLFSTAPIFIFFWPNSGMESPVSNLTAFIFYQFSTDLWYGDTCFCIEPALVWTKLFTLGMVKTLKSLVSYVLALQDCRCSSSRDSLMGIYDTV